MPADDLFDESDTQSDPGAAALAAADRAAAAGDPPLAGQSPAGGSADMSRLVETVGQLASAVRGVVDRVGGLEQRLHRPAAPAGQQPPAKLGDPLTEMMADPKGFIAGIAREAVDGTVGQLAPFFESMADSATSVARDKARTEIDAQWGSGVFDAVVGDELDTALRNLPAASRAKEDHVRALTMGVFGGKINTEDGRKAFSAARKAAKERAPVPGVLTGHSRNMPEKPSLGDGEREAIKRLEAAGIPFSESAYLDAMQRGDSEDDWGSPIAQQSDYWNAPVEPAKPNGKAA